jgi:predicted acetyltransferase
MNLTYSQILSRFVSLPAGSFDRDGLHLELTGLLPAIEEKGYVPSFVFQIEHPAGTAAGEIRLRVGNTRELICYRGHIGYDVHPEFRGHRLAAKSVSLLLPLANAVGLSEVYLTCDPENQASARSIELAGGEFIEELALPPSEEMYQEGKRSVLRYVIKTVPPAKGSGN